MTRKRATPPKIRKRKPRFVLDTYEPQTGPKVQSRLFSSDDEYLRAKMIATGKGESDVIRALVRKGIASERLENASKDPNVKNLLKVVETTLAEHSAKLERRLSVELHTLRRLIATAVVLSSSSMRLLELYAATGAPPTPKALEERRRSFLNTLSRQLVAEAEEMLDSMLTERELALSSLAEIGLTSPVKDTDLNVALDAQSPSPADQEDEEDINP